MKKQHNSRWETMSLTHHGYMHAIMYVGNEKSWNDDCMKQWGIYIYIYIS